VQAGQGSKDGYSSGDHNAPYQWGRTIWSGWPYPFTHVQLARLLILRGRIQDGYPKPGRD